MASPMLLVRARDADGRFIADDPATPDVDEAWVAAPQDNDTNSGVTV